MRVSSAIAIGALIALLGLFPRVCSAEPFIWDDDGDGIDDRMETVNLLGIQFSFQDADSTQHQRFLVSRLLGNLIYGVYVVYEHAPNDTDRLALTLLGMPVLHQFEGINAIRSTCTFVQAGFARNLPGVKRIETVPILYGVARDDAASMGVSDPSNQVFPTWASSGGGQGNGVVVAILDTGVNDEAEGVWPGHESLVGKELGGASLVYGDSIFDTPPDGNVNPADHGSSATQAHATHVAGLILGTGGETGLGGGIAPQARFIDVKVLNDAGVGGAVPEALDWCIHNRSRDWGAGSAWTGIDVINLSLSTLDTSDGNDVASKLAARAVELGIVVVASTGNEGHDHFIPSPAAGDGVLAIGAYDAQRSGRAGDDVFASFSDYGPRASDGDADAFDEMKPDLLAPGMAVLSADGDLSSDGAQYVRKSGTSMAAALVSGAVAVLRSEFPALTPGQIASVLRSTARRGLTGSPAGVAGPDPRWSSSEGWGALDLYAARLELLQPHYSQVRRLVLEPAETAIAVQIWTGRERGAAHFVLERAADVSGSPGAFVALDSVAAAGDSSLADDGLQTYPLSLAVPPAERGQPFWYRVAFTEGGIRRNGPARRVVGPVGPPVATLEIRIVHNAYDHDVQGVIEVGGAQSALWSGPTGLNSPPPAISLPGSSAAVATDWVSGVSALGNVAWDFRIDLNSDVAGDWVPPTQGMPWRLRIDDGGYVNRSGRIESYRLVWHSPEGDVVYEGGPAPQPTIEGGTAVAQVPAPVATVDEPTAASVFRAGPNPVRAGGLVTFTARGLPARGVRVFDLAGREVRRPDPLSGSWRASDRAGDPLAAGVYFARAAGVSARVVVVR